MVTSSRGFTNGLFPAVAGSKSGDFTSCFSLQCGVYGRALLEGKSKSPIFPEGRGWSGGAMVLDKLPMPGRPTIWITVGQGPAALAVGAGWRLFGHVYSHLSFFSLSLGDCPI